MDAESQQLFVQILIHKFRQFQRTFIAKQLARGGVYVAEDQIQPGLAGQPEFPQIRSFWKDVTEFYMFILQRAFLS